MTLTSCRCEETRSHVRRDTTVRTFTVINLNIFFFSKFLFFLYYSLSVSNPLGCELDFRASHFVRAEFILPRDKLINREQIAMQTWKYRSTCGSRLDSPLNTPSPHECDVPTFNYNRPTNSVAVENLPSQSERYCGLSYWHTSYLFAVHKLDIVSIFHSLIGVSSTCLPYGTNGMTFDVSR